MPKIEWLAEALDDLDRLFDFLYPINPKAAEKIYRLLAQGPSDLLGSPEIGRPMLDDPNFREYIVPFGARAYIIRYRYERETIFVTRIWHGLENR